MTNVIQFPSKSIAEVQAEHGAPVAPELNTNFGREPADFSMTGTLALLEQSFPVEAYSDLESGELMADDSSWEWLGELFNRCGLRLPLGASAQEAKTVWGEIFALYAPAIRMYVKSPEGEGLQWLLTPLNPQQLLYAKAISIGDTKQAQRLAASLFNRPNLRQFIVAH